MPSRIVTPVEALRAAVALCRGSDPGRVATLEARGCFLVEPVVVGPAAVSAGAGERSPEAAGASIALRNGYALPCGFAGGRCRVRSRALEAAGRDAPAGFRIEQDDSLPLAERVESGDVVPRWSDRVLPVSAAVVVGPSVIEVDPTRVPPETDGVAPAGEPIALDAGTELTPRLQAFLAAGGVHEVTVRSAWDVGVGTIGSELVDPTTLSAPAPVDPPGRERVVGDVTGVWLPEAVRGAGLRAQTLGAAHDDPAEILDLLRRAERLGLRTVIIAGGLGDGIDDRTVETVRNGPFRIVFEDVSMSPGGRMLVAQGMGIDVLALGGAPLDAACAYDLFAGPALRAALGAPPEVWDWTRAVEQGPPPAGIAPDADLWSVFALIAGADGEEYAALPRHAPATPRQVAWALHAPAADPPARRYRVPRAPGA